MQVDFSIIVPVYNVGEYMEKCIDSILKATKENDEIIIVCGNSNDNSSELSMKYSKTYENIKMLKQSKTGLSNARNDGLKTAKGEYVLFLDGDDFVDSEVLCKFLDEIRNKKYDLDVLITDFYKYKQTIDLTVSMKQFGEDRIQGLENIISKIRRGVCFWNVWRYVYRREFLLDNEMQFLENAYAEDLDFTIRIFLSKVRILFVPTAYYHYRVGREGSLIDKTPVKRVISTLEVIENSIELLQKSDAPQKQKLIDSLQFEYILNFALIYEIPKTERSKVLPIVRKDLLKNSQDKIVRIMYCVVKIFGIRFTANILWRIKRIKRKKEGRSL